MLRLSTIIIIYFLLFSKVIIAQQTTLTGKVLEVTENSKTTPLPFVNIFWLGSNIGTATNNNGEFSINRLPNKNKLIVSFVGYTNDTILIDDNQSNIDIILASGITLENVEVKSGLEGAYISKLKPLKTEIITEHGLQKLACCNLSESFENNATVDVGFSDAVSGAKQIQMLGLAGIYSQLITENIPAIRGLASTYGLDYIPGSWMEAIQISKGTSSVINGYESTTGQINVEYKKPQRSDKLHLNFYANTEQRLEGNLTAATKVGDKFHTMVMAHTSVLENSIDMNKDGFLDMPKGNRINILNRWVYDGKKEECIQLVINGLQEFREGGQVNFYNDKNAQNQDYYGIGINTQRVQAFLKAGFPLHFRHNTSIGFQLSSTFHEQKSYFGNNSYYGKENSFYSNVIYQSYIVNTNHLFSTGASYMQDLYNESFNDSSFSKKEHIPGAFFQYNYKYIDKFDLIIGFRADDNSRYGAFLTPRVHLRYDINNLTTIRASAGKGYRSPLLISENLSCLASSRNFIIQTNLKAEEAVNYGGSIVREFHWDKDRNATFSIDIYRTEFINQIIIDLNKTAREVNFYNLNGTSRSNSFQANFDITPFKGASITTAFRYNDVKATINDEFIEKPFVTKYKGLLVLSYLTKFDKWQFDFTTQYNGKSRLPSTADNPNIYKRNNFSKEYFMLYAQITKRFKHIDIYLGAENITNFVQSDPIVDADNPFGQYFDASMIWGPIYGRMFYTGLRYTIK